MAYTRIAILLPLLGLASTSPFGQAQSTSSIPASSQVSQNESLTMLTPSPALVCLIDSPCAEDGASLTIKRNTLYSKLTLRVGASSDERIVNNTSADDVTLTVECDGQSFDIKVSTSAPSWGMVSSCQQVVCS